MKSKTKSPKPTGPSRRDVPTLDWSHRTVSCRTQLSVHTSRAAICV